jgi:hemerythrin-like domain-containing protein
MLESPTTSPDFQNPLALLRACHGRVERFATLAARIADHLDEQGVPEEAAANAAGRVLRYFNQAAPLHHADEEADLLPRLRTRLRTRLPEPAAPELRELLTGLEGEHQWLDGHWQGLKPLLERVARGEAVSADFRARAEAFRDAQLDHLARENRWILPAAEQHLGASDWAAIGNAMARRRGVGQNTQTAGEAPS